MFVAFLGCDGSGKSTVITDVANQLRMEGTKVSLGHWRPRVLEGEEESGEKITADNPHGEPPRGLVSSIVKLAWLGFNWWGGWWRWLRRRSRDGVILYDRYHVDLFVDPKRYRYGGPLWMVKLASNLMPQPDLVVFLDAEPAVLISRKQEVSKEALQASRTAYLELVKTHRKFVMVDASKPLNEVVKIVIQKIRLKRDGSLKRSQ